MVRPDTIEPDLWAMFVACAEGDLASVQKLIRQDPWLAHREFEYRKPLHFAVRENRLDIVRVLLDAGADPTAELGTERPLTLARDRDYGELVDYLESRLRQEYGITPEGATLAEAIRNRDITAVRRISPEMIHAADERGNRPIHWAVMTRQLALIDHLLERGADINAMRPDGAYPIDLANGDYWYRGWRDVPALALRAYPVLIGYLVARGAHYSISVAAHVGDVDRIRELLDRDPDLVSRVPRYSMYYSGLPLRCAARVGNFECVKLLLERGADPNGPEPMCPTGGALRSAVGAKHLEIVKLLLEHGADPNQWEDSSGNCMWAAQDSPEISRLLAAYGGVIRFDLACYDGNATLAGAMLHANPAMQIPRDALHNAMSEGHEHLIDTILRHQPDALRGVALGDVKDASFARRLVDCGADPARANWLGVTPLHRFAAQGNLDVASVCLEHGADVNAIDDEYRSTPLGWAARAGQRAAVEWLLEHGATAGLPVNEPWAQPAAWARRRGHREIARLL
jgi:ankyrin repeat protein